MASSSALADFVTNEWTLRIFVPILVSIGTTVVTNAFKERRERASHRHRIFEENLRRIRQGCETISLKVQTHLCGVIEEPNLKQSRIKVLTESKAIRTQIDSMASQLRKERYDSLVKVFQDWHEIQTGDPFPLSKKKDAIPFDSPPMQLRRQADITLFIEIDLNLSDSMNRKIKL
jgi:hypothetical protein